MPITQGLGASWKKVALVQGGLDLRRRTWVIGSFAPPADPYLIPNIYLPAAIWRRLVSCDGFGRFVQCDN